MLPLPYMNSRVLDSKGTKSLGFFSEIIFKSWKKEMRRSVFLFEELIILILVSKDQKRNWMKLLKMINQKKKNSKRNQKMVKWKLFQNDEKKNIHTKHEKMK